MDKVFKHLDAVERKITKANAIAAKGDNLQLKDAIKLGRKSNSIVSTCKKGIKDYDVSVTEKEKGVRGSR